MKLTSVSAPQLAGPTVGIGATVLGLVCGVSCCIFLCCKYRAGESLGQIFCGKWCRRSRTEPGQTAPNAPQVTVGQSNQAQDEANEEKSLRFIREKILKLNKLPSP